MHNAANLASYRGGVAELSSSKIIEAAWTQAGYSFVLVA